MNGAPQNISEQEQEALKFLDQKSIRKLGYLWNKLVNPNNFLIPETIDDHIQLGGFFAPKIKIDSTECYFNEKSKNDLEGLVNTLYEIETIRSIVSYDTVYKTAISFIESAVHKLLKHSIKPNSEKDIQNIILMLIRKKLSYQLLRIVEGVELKGIESLVLGNIEIFVFSEKHEIEMQSYRENNNLNSFFDVTVIPFIKEHLLNRVCIKITAVGDDTKSEEIATKQINQAINILRFMICIVANGKFLNNAIKISLLAESYNASENTIKVNLTNKELSLNYGKSRSPLQKFLIDPRLVDELRERCFFNDWITVLSKNNKTELEEAILTAIYWIGEAQNDFDYESAFIKYWIALETLFTISKENITESLSKGIAVLLAFGGYRFIETSEVETMLKTVERLYDKRSKVVHRGIYEAVSPMELAEVCKYAVWSILTCFGLMSSGYETLEQTKNETNRLYDLSKRACSCRS